MHAIAVVTTGPHSDYLHTYTATLACAGFLLRKRHCLNWSTETALRR